MSRVFRHELVLALHLFSRGLAFVEFEGSLAPYDWGVKEVRGSDKNPKCLAIVRKLLHRDHPAYLVIEDETASKRVPRIRHLHRAICKAAEEEGVVVRRFSKADVRATFAQLGEVTKYDIAQRIVKDIPAFVLRLPRPRKIWMSEDPRMSLFDAAALGLTFYSSTQSSQTNQHSPTAGATS